MNYHSYFLIVMAFLRCWQSASMQSDDEYEEEEEGVKPPPQNLRSLKEQRIMTKLLETNEYKSHVRPPGLNTSNPKNGGPVVIWTTLLLKSITNINDANMEISAQFRFQQEWRDIRLRFEDELDPSEDLVLNLAISQTKDWTPQIWIPDTFFSNEKTGKYHDVDRPNAFVRIDRDGSIIYNRRMSMTFSCPMQLVRYPHDTQQCLIDFTSYAYTTDDIVYEWSPAAIVYDMKAAMRPKFSIESLTNDTCTSKTNTGSYSCLRTKMELRRVFSFFLLQLYIPSFMLVSVSCVSYWIDWKVAPARVPLSIVTLLAMITQSYAINSSLPPVSYTKAIDLWIGACIGFIFSSLIEYAIVNYTGVNEQRRKAKQREAHQAQTQQVGYFFASGTPTATSAVDLRPAPPVVSASGSSSQLLNSTPRTVSNASKPPPPPAYYRQRRKGGIFDKIRKPFGFGSSDDLRSPVARRLAESGTLVDYYSQPSTVSYFDRDGSLMAAIAFGSGAQAPSSTALHTEQVPLAPMTLADIEDPNFQSKRTRNRRLFAPLNVCKFLASRGRAERIDIVSRALFPSLFICFNCVYWTVYW